MNSLFTSESVSEGHPDKLCDAVSDALLDLHLRQDPCARAAIETMATTNRIILAGETAAAKMPSREQIDQTVRDVICCIGYDQPGFSWKTVKITNLLHAQSADIARGVDNCGAGDQGIMFGYACVEPGFDCAFMPLAIQLSHRILEDLAARRHRGEIPGIEPDAKTQVTVRYQDGRPVGIDTVVLSTQHRPEVSPDRLREMVLPSLSRVIPEGWLPPEEKILINPTGRFVIGGPDGDTGLTGRKIVVDTYGGYVPHGGGAFSGKDPTKVDRSGAYALRWLAKNIVAAGLAGRCLLQIAYAIGVADPVALYINTFGTAEADEAKLLKILRELADLTPQGIIKRLDLRRPIYYPCASYGHFGRCPGADGTFSWEKLNLVSELKSCF